MTNYYLYKVSSKFLVHQINNFSSLCTDKTYVDHAGTTLYADSQIEAASNTLRESVFCNPHTCSSTSDMVDHVRYR